MIIASILGRYYVIRHPWRGYMLTTDRKKAGRFNNKDHALSVIGKASAHCLNGGLVSFQINFEKV